ncbi:MAG: heme/copper-type cytochrome/quinol oxidase subunit 2 [Glaciecola sp.]|jgi:heme/copper-type cytochrome/quinol oxidase subunit 2
MLKLFPSLIFTLLVVFVVSFVLGYQTEIAHSPAGWDGALLISLLATIIAAIALLILGLPLYFTLQHLNKSKMSYYLLGGALPGFMIVFLFKPLGNDALPTLLLQGAAFTISGAFVAGVFWYFSRKINA